MKSTKIIFALCVASYVGVAHGASMCIPSIGGYVYTATGTEDNNRGYFANGGSCSVDSATKTITCTSTPTIRGESHCSASGTSFSETGGKFCWCRLTDVISSNGYLSPRAGGWVFQYDYGSLSRCASFCADYCAYYARSSRGFRRALFASPGT